MPDRRTFLKGMVAVGGLALMPGGVSRALAWANPRPILYGDGSHNDAPALNALFAGEDVDVRDNATRVLDDGSIWIDRGTYLLNDKVYIPYDRRTVSITNSRFDRAGVSAYA